MLFVLGLDRLSHEEKAAILAQMKVLNGLSMLREGARSGADTAARVGKDMAARLRRRLRGTRLELPPPRTDSRPDKKDTSGQSGLALRIEAEAQALRLLPGPELDAEFRSRMAQIAGMRNAGAAAGNRSRLQPVSGLGPCKDEDQNPDMARVSQGILRRAARRVRINPKEYADEESLEQAIIQKAVQQIVDGLQKRLARMSAGELESVESALRTELSRLSQADAEAIKRALGLRELSSQSALTVLKTASSTVLAQAVAGGFGFGFYLFLTTAIKAFSLLLGVTLPFGVYTAATSLAGFLLSAAFLPVAAVLGAGVATLVADRQVHDELAKLLVVVGRSRLALTEPERG